MQELEKRRRKNQMS